MRGSAGLETLILVLVTIYLTAVIYKAVVKAGFAFVEDEYRVALAGTSAHKIRDTVAALASSSPGTRKVITISLPDNSSISCSAGSAQLRVSVDTVAKYTNSKCSGNTCSSAISLDLSCDNGFSVTGPVNNKDIALVKIGGSKVKIGEPA